jgi:signal transduction histidine kinase
MKTSLQTRIFGSVMIVALISVLATGWLVRNRMLISFRSLDANTLSYRADIYDYLSASPLYTGSLNNLSDDVYAAAERGKDRVVLTDQDRNVLADSEPGKPIAKRIDFVIAVPMTRFAERNTQRTSACFAAARMTDWNDLPDRFTTFQQLVDAIDSPPTDGDDFDLTVAELDTDTAADLKRCLSPEFEFNGPLGLVFVGNGQQETLRIGALGPWTLLLTAVLGLASLFALFVAKRVTEPLRTLTSATAKLSHGNLSDRIPSQKSKEVSELINAFNDMASRLETVEQQRTQLVRDVSHELRNPLGVLQSQIEAAIDGVVPMDEHALEVMHNEVTQLTSLVNDLQQLAGFDEGSVHVVMTTTSLTTVVQNVVDNYRIAHPELHFNVALENVTVHGDPVRLRQVAANLVRNATQHTPTGGTITATVKHVGSVAVLAVTDTGAGIEASHLPHVFERFWRADDSRRRDGGDRGAGLGLSICKAIVDAHRGTIVVSSEPGVGTTFSITLPDAQNFTGPLVETG